MVYPTELIVKNDLEKERGRQIFICLVNLTNLLIFAFGNIYVERG